MSKPMQFNPAKLKAAILHTCEAVPPAQLGAVKLHKVLYFLDMIHYAQTGMPVTGAAYKKRPFGPTCVPLLPILREMEFDGQIEIRDVSFHGLLKKEYVARVPETAGVLNPNEIELLDDVIAFVCGRNSARSISEFSHKLPWEMAEFGGVIPYESALLLFPVEASPEAFDAAGKGAKEIEAERSGEESVVFTDISDFRSRVLSADRFN